MKGTKRETLRRRDPGQVSFHGATWSGNLVREHGQMDHRVSSVDTDKQNLRPLQGSSLAMPCAPAPLPQHWHLHPLTSLRSRSLPCWLQGREGVQPPQVLGLRTLPPAMGLPWPRDLPRMPCHAWCGHHGHTNWEGR